MISWNKLVIESHAEFGSLDDDSVEINGSRINIIPSHT